MPPLNAVGPVGGPGQGMGVVLWAASIAIFCVGQLLGSLNFITTTLDLRVKGMSLMRLPLTAWAWFITSCMGLTAFAVLMPACILVILDHVAGTSFFVPSGLVINDQLQPHSGGSTLLWQHLFWFFGHPEVYIAIVPGMGIVSHILITNMRRPLLSHRVMIGCMAAIAVLSYMVYGHHMFVSGMNPFSSLAFSFPHVDYHHSRDHHCFALDRQPVWLQITNQLGFAVCAGLHFDVCCRRRKRILPGSALH